MGKLTSKSNFALLSSFLVKFERVINSLGQNHISCESKYGLSGSSVKTENFIWEVIGMNNLYFWGPKVKNAICNGTFPPAH